MICYTYVNSFRTIWRTVFVSLTGLASYKCKRNVKVVQATSCRLYTAMSVSPVRYFKKTFNILFLSCVQCGVNIIAIFVSFSHSTGQSGNARVTEFRFSKLRNQSDSKITSPFASDGSRSLPRSVDAAVGSYFNYTIFQIFLLFFSNT